jgi:hypothetical protein
MGIKDITWEGFEGLETIFYYTFFLYTRWHGRFLLFSPPDIAAHGMGRALVTKPIFTTDHS